MTRAGDADAGLARDAARERRFFLSLSLPALAVVGLGAILPILWILRQSVLNLGGEVTLANWTKMLNSGLTWSALQTTFLLSGLTPGVCLALGTTLALASGTVRIAPAAALHPLEVS
jgi:putative spermidine/putrescine transport system permease protein